MRNAIDQYLDEVLACASLARDDDRRVRAELRDHLEELTAAALENSSNQKEVLAMLNSEFGNPDAVGRAIASAKGRLRTYLKKQKVRLPIGFAIGLIVLFTIRCAVAEEFYAATNGIAPIIPQGSRMIIYKLVSAFHPGDVIVFRSPEGTAIMGVVAGVSDDGTTLTVAKNHEPDRIVLCHDVVGRVVLNTR